MDIYGNKANLIEAFEEFAERTREEGKILLKAGLKLERSEVDGYYAIERVTDNYSDHYGYREIIIYSITTDRKRQ